LSEQHSAEVSNMHHITLATQRAVTLTGDGGEIDIDAAISLMTVLNMESTTE